MKNVAGRLEMKSVARRLEMKSVARLEMKNFKREYL